MEDLVARIRKLRKEVIRTLPYVRNEIDNIINNKVTSMPRIERTLDLLLDFISLGYGEGEFKELNAYYQTIHSEYSEAYARLFKEFF